MEITTMTNATRITRVRVACPQVARTLITTAGIADVRQGTAVSAFGIGAGVTGFTADAPQARPAFYAPMHKLVSKDVAYLRTGRPPV